MCALKDRGPGILYRLPIQGAGTTDHLSFSFDDGPPEKKISSEREFHIQGNLKQSYEIS